MWRQRDRGWDRCRQNRQPYPYALRPTTGAQTSQETLNDNGLDCSMSSDPAFHESIYIRRLRRPIGSFKVFVDVRVPTRFLYGLVEATIRGWTDVRTRRGAIGKVSNKLHNGFGMGRAVPSRIHTEHNSVENHDLLDLSLCANICCLTFLFKFFFLSRSSFFFCRSSLFVLRCCWLFLTF